ncbi:type II toxin-antitoxin system PemK/MazF family toxin [Candidatus Pacearchaeota archaeon]|nr:type II toxin-antitoxin system PemK/MazF family toxin [Candidatus Pacearchaeota archaeon]
MEGLVKGDVIVVNFPYSDLKTYKRRPVLIIKVPRGEDIIACQVTAEPYEKSVEMALKKEDFHTGYLKRDSYLRVDKISSIEKYLIQYKIGRIKKEKFDEIINRIVFFLKD